VGRRNKGRKVDGILLLNKPGGVTSNGILQRIKRLYGAAKAGHTGALDPLATGLLPLTFGEATKFSQHLLDSDKRYQTTAKLGIRTDSSDADGEVVETKAVPDFTEADIQLLLDEHFTGEIEQVPSMYSALKFNGQPLYKLARKGIQVEVKPRRVTIFDIQILAIREDEIDLEVHCSKGTYIRSIVEDLGLLLGCGAHVSMLHRLDAGPYKASMMIDVEKLEAIAELNEPPEMIQHKLDALLLPAWTALGDTPAVNLSAKEAALIGNGQKIVWTGSEMPAPIVRLFNGETEQFLGIAELTDEKRLIPKRLIAN